MPVFLPPSRGCFSGLIPDIHVTGDRDGFAFLSSPPLLRLLRNHPPLTSSYL